MMTAASPVLGRCPNPLGRPRGSTVPCGPKPGHVDDLCSRGLYFSLGRLPTSVLTVGLPVDRRTTLTAVERAFLTFSGNKIKSGLCVWELLEAILLPAASATIWSQDILKPDWKLQEISWSPCCQEPAAVKPLSTSERIFAQRVI